MALIKFGGGILEMRGKIGGNVYSKNRYGNYVRQGTIPVNPNSSRQAAVRADMASIVSAWTETLTAVQRAAWEVYAAAINFVNQLGETITLTGYNHFVRCNISRLNNGVPLTAVAPTTLTLPATDPSFVVSLSEATQQVSVAFDDTAAWCSEDGAFMTIHQGVPQPGGRNFYGKYYRRIGWLLGNSGTPITSPQLIAVSFPIAEDQKDWIAGRIQLNDARLSEMFRDDAIVAA